MNFRDKLIAWDQLPAWRNIIRASGKKLVVTNDCFDLLHPSHVTCLENARNFGDALLLGVNSDAAVRGLKGTGRQTCWPQVSVLFCPRQPHLATSTHPLRQSLSRKG